VDSISERIKNGCNVAIHAGVVMPYIRHGHADQPGESARTIDSDPFRIPAKVTAAGQAVAAPPADHVPLGTDEVPGPEVHDVRAGRHHLAHKFVADHHRNRDCPARPVVPFVDVKVGSTNPGPQHSNKHIVDAGFGFGNILQGQTGTRRRFNEGFHDRPSMEGFHLVTLSIIWDKFPAS